MLSWASNRLEQLAQTVAPPPQDAVSRFLYLVQRGDEGGAQGCLAELHDPFHAVVQPTKGSYPLHLACQHGMERLIRQLLTMPGANIQVPDSMGNSPLHYACMNTNANTALNTVQLLVTQYSASVVTKNAENRTPYDMCNVNSVRQYLLPLQLQQETQHAIDNGGIGLPPGIDLGGMQITNSHMPPPPVGGMLNYSSGGGPPKGHVPPPMPIIGGGSAGAPPPLMGAGGPPPPMGAGAYPPMGAGAYPPVTPQASGVNAGVFTTPSPSMAAPPQAAPAPVAQPPAAPASGGQHAYARTGHSSAVVGGANKYRPDGFHSSSSDVNLQRKYGNVTLAGPGAAGPPPPSSGNSVPGASPASGGYAANPYAGGANPYARGAPTRSRYLAHDGTAVAQPAAPGSGYGYPAAAAPAAGNFTTFNPAGPGFQQQQHQQYQQQPQGYQQQQQYQQQPSASPAQPYQQQPAPSPAQQYQQQPSAQAYQQSYHAQPQAAAPVVASPYQQQQYATPATPSTPSSSFMPPPPLSGQSPYAQSAQQQQPVAAAAAANTTPAKEAPSMPFQQPMQNYVSTGSLASAQDLFSGPTPEKAAPTDVSPEQPPANGMARVVSQETPSENAASLFGNSAPVADASSTFDSPPAAAAPVEAAPVSTGSAADVFGAAPAASSAPAAAIQAAPTSTGSAADLFGTPAATPEAAGDVFGSPSKAAIQPSPTSTGSAADLFGAPAATPEVAFSSPPKAAATPEVAFSSPPKAAATIQPSPASAGSAADLFGAPATEAAPAPVEDKPEPKSITVPKPTLQMTEIMEDSMDGMQDVPLDSTTPSAAQDVFGLPPPPTFG